jgi:K+-sensing histidine kinase KdpD
LEAKEKFQKRSAKNSSLLSRLALLQEIARKIDGARSKEEIFEAVRSEARWILDYQLCFAGLVNRSQTHYVVHALSPLADAAELNHRHIPLDEGMAGWVIRNNAPIIEDIESGPVFTFTIEGKMQELGIASLLIVPLRFGSDIIGSLAFGTPARGHFSQEDQTVAQLLSLHLASALRNISIVDDARRRITQIDTINNVSRKLTSMLNLDELLSEAASMIQKTFNYFDVTVFLLTDDRKELILSAHAGNFVDFLPMNYRQPVDQGIIGWVARQGEKISSNDVSLDPRYLIYEYHNTKSELAIPIRIDEEIVGVLNVEDTKLHAFDDTDALVLETLSDQLGIALRNAKLYAEIRRSNMKLTELDKMKSEFLGIVSHDFRSPLASIMLAGKALLKNEGVQEMPRVKEYLQLIVNQANRLNMLAEDTLSIAKLESGRLSYFFKIVNLERLIQDAVALVRFSSRHEFEYSLNADVRFIKGDQSKLRQVIQNLVSNAVKYSPRGGKVKIVVEEFSTDQVIIAVSDQGIGIPADKADKLFQKFSRVDSGEAKEIKGAGLGLWICREVVEAHGGKIWIESEEGKGSTFKLTLDKAQE